MKLKIIDTNSSAADFFGNNDMADFYTFSAFGKKTGKTLNIPLKKSLPAKNFLRKTVPFGKFALIILLFSAVTVLFSSCIKCSTENSFSSDKEKTVFISHSAFTGSKSFKKTFSSESVEIFFDAVHKEGTVNIHVKDSQGIIVKTFENPVSEKDVLNLKCGEEYSFEMEFKSHTGKIKFGVKEIYSVFENLPNRNSVSI